MLFENLYIGKANLYSKWEQWICTSLAQRYPKSAFIQNYLKANGLISTIVVNLRDECSAESSLTEFIELIVDETEENAALSDSAVADYDHLNLR